MFAPVTWYPGKLIYFDFFEILILFQIFHKNFMLLLLVELFCCTYRAATCKYNTTCCGVPSLPTAHHSGIS
jgi:hypothetical protein